ncbi:MAG: hypothetical protein KDH96_12535 [Candidatus Riesia sp.]|nr:hypothetical protein [Candidatus Riesia sp.]
MKHLKYFEHIDPFKEEDWEEEEITSNFLKKDFFFIYYNDLYVDFEIIKVKLADKENKIQIVFIIDNKEYEISDYLMDYYEVRIMYDDIVGEEFDVRMSLVDNDKDKVLEKIEEFKNIILDSFETTPAMKDNKKSFYEFIKNSSPEKIFRDCLVTHV